MGRSGPRQSGGAPITNIRNVAGEAAASSQRCYFAGTPTPVDAIADLVEGTQNVADCTPHSASLQENSGERAVDVPAGRRGDRARPPGDDRPLDRRDRRGVSRGGRPCDLFASVALSSIRKDFQITPTSRWRREGWAQRTRTSHLASHCGSSARRSGAGDGDLLLSPSVKIGERGRGGADAAGPLSHRRCPRFLLSAAAARTRSDSAAPSTPSASTLCCPSISAL